MPQQVLAGDFAIQHSAFQLSEHSKLGESLISADPGKLSLSTTKVLKKLYLDIGREWALMEPSEENTRIYVLEDFLAAKTEQAPSYLGEYENAVHLLRESLPFSMDLESKVGHVRHYVVREFAELHLVSGGFRRFGFKNYFGHPGGSLTEKPYR